jgi:hypothetical protein
VSTETSCAFLFRPKQSAAYTVCYTLVKKRIKKDMDDASNRGNLDVKCWELDFTYALKCVTRILAISSVNSADCHKKNVHAIDC